MMSVCLFFCQALFESARCDYKGSFKKKHLQKKGLRRVENAGVDSNLRIPDTELRILWLESQDSHKLIGDQCGRRVERDIFNWD